MKLTEEEKEKGLDELFGTLRAELGLMTLIQSGSNLINDENQIQNISKVVDNAIARHPRGKEIALASLLTELSELKEVKEKGHYRYHHDPEEPRDVLSKREILGLDRYIDKLKKEIAKLLPPIPINPSM